MYSFLHSLVNFLYISSCTLPSIICDFYSMWLFSTFPTAAPYVSRCEALELYCFLGEMPRASVQELRGVGACRLKYLQWRHAMASFIRCLTSWTIKLSSMLNHKVKSCFFLWQCFIHFFPLKGIMSLFENATSHSFNTIWKCIILTRCHLVK